MSDLARFRVSATLEMLLWCGVLALLVMTLGDVARSTWPIVHGRAPWSTFAWRSLFEFVVIGLLVLWPMIRAQIKYGYAMKGHEDNPWHVWDETCPPRWIIGKSRRP